MCWHGNYDSSGGWIEIDVSAGQPELNGGGVAGARAEKRTGAPENETAVPRPLLDNTRTGIIQVFDNPLSIIRLIPMDVSGLVSGAGGFIASAFVVAGYTMRTMIPLRIFGILTNVFLIAYSLPHHHYAIMALHLILLPLNVYRLREMLLLVREVKKSVNSDLSMAWLKPFMTERKCRTGEVLFYKHEKAEEMFYIVNGRFRLVESGIELPNGAIVGELGMLSPSNKRTQTLECIEGGLVLSVTYQKVEELYVQNPEFGFYFLRLVSARLFQNVGRLEAQLAQGSAQASS
jgi:hypothetical protein